MARQTATDLLRRVRKRLGNPPSDEITDTDILRFLNLALMETISGICATGSIPQLLTSTTVTTVSGTAEYELSATDVIKIVSARNTTDSIPMQSIDVDDYNRFQPSSTLSTGSPVYWFISGRGSSGGDNVKLFPCPDGVKSIVFDYLKKPTELVTSPAATSPILPETYDQAIIDLAVRIGYPELDRIAEAMIAGSLSKTSMGASKRTSPTGSSVVWGTQSRISDYTSSKD
jgi:hypothetical protein